MTLRATGRSDLVGVRLLEVPDRRALRDLEDPAVGIGRVRLRFGEDHRLGQQQQVLIVRKKVVAHPNRPAGDKKMNGLPIPQTRVLPTHPRINIRPPYGGDPFTINYELRHCRNKSCCRPLPDQDVW